MQRCSNFPEIILDENIFSHDLQYSLSSEGYKVKFMGVGASDEQIEKYVLNNDAVLVTADVELDSHMSWKKSLLLESHHCLRDKLFVIRAFVSQFTRIA